MLFKKDMFDLVLEGQTDNDLLPIKDTSQDAWEMSLEFCRVGNWSDAYDILKGFIPLLYRKSPLEPLQCQILGLAAVCRAYIEAAERRWNAAADWLWTALTRCPSFSCDAIDTKLPHQYLTTV